jgi:dienelactone hydrolase
MEALAFASLLAVAGFSAWDGAPAFQESKSDLLVYLDKTGTLHPVRTIADWRVRREHVLQRMQLVMGDMPDRAKAVPLDMKVIEETDCPKYVRKKITFAVESWDRLPAYLLIPKELKGKVPGILCLHPTSEFGKEVVVGLREKPNRNYAEELAERGYVTLAPDYPGFGEYVASRRMLYEKGYASCTMKGIWNHRRCVDLLESLPEVDGSRIGCIGHSLGGHNTLFAGVFDERIKVMVSSCGFTAFPKYMDGDLTGWTHDGYMPRIATVYEKDPAKMPFDFTEVLGVLAPRAVFVNAPLHDDNFDASGVEDCIRAAKPVFELFGVKDNLRVVHPEGGHDFPVEAREQAYAFIDHALK